MSALFNRAFSFKGYDKNGKLIIEIDQNMNNKMSQQALRVVFNITQHTSMVNNIAEFTIFNCSDNTKSLLLMCTYFTFEAGYIGNTKLIFKGNNMNVFNQRPQPDTAHSIYCLDYIDYPIPVNLIIPTTMTDRQAIKTLGAITPDLIVMDINLHDLKDVPMQKNISLVNLTAWQAFQKLGLLLNLNFWQVNRVLYCSSTTDGSIPADSPKTILNYNNGMLKSPVFDIANAGVNVQSLLNGQLVPGTDVIIETISPQVQYGAVNYAKFNQDAVTRGTWRIFQTDHVGDSRGEAWFSELQAYSFQATIDGVIPVNE